MLLTILLELPFPKTGAFGIEYASLSLVRIGNPGPELLLLNYTPWRNAG